jgi:hypothetical protein
VDHLNAEGIKEKIAGKAHGAIRKMAQARVAWEVRKVQEEESDSYSVGLFHTKHNNTRKYAPLGFRLSFESDQYGRARARRVRARGCQAATATPQPPLSTPPVAVGPLQAQPANRNTETQHSATVAVGGGRLPYADDDEELDDAPF